ncbi:hypothetical protein FH608_007400 [Nonomuraea phyllanthi]|uniref:ORC1/DEAH AAA+ ATPase domain-containing protein n=1 Tax=Nonomuraea phyllanthi TaxID=2219224 RepID=A0A5C4WSC1_9ACTN|nr:tetratricopeptide repeat protein [Nonomuraea phyllanthi]KAB8196547.1 hypothetical protein FH608_007400 [Nonomuraea phyllanthi]
MGKQGKLWLLSTIAFLVAFVVLGSSAGWWPILADKSNVAWAESVGWLAGIVSAIVSIVGLYISIYTLVIDRRERARGTSAEREQQPPQTDQPPATGAPPLETAARITGIVDREDELPLLRTRLTKGPWGIVIVTGALGVGKTRLVNQVLDELGNAPGGPRIFRHEAVPGLGIDVHVLVADIETLLDDEAVRWPDVIDGAPAERLRASLDELPDTPAVIVIDRAEHLLDPATHELNDPELGEVFEVLATEQHHIAVVLVTRDMPKSAARGTWAQGQPAIRVGELTRTFFRAFVKSLTTQPGVVRKLVRHHALFRGNLRLVELACVLARSPQFGLHKLSDGLERLKGPQELPRFLVENLTAGLDTWERSALAALDAYGTAVDAAAVRELLPEPEPGKKPRLDEVRDILAGLADKRVADETRDGQYRIALSEEERAWAGLPGEDGPVDEQTKDLLIRAAKELARRRVTPPRTAGDLSLHFAGLRALTRAGRPQLAYNRIEDIDGELRKRHCAFLLREPREKLRGKLEKHDPEREMDNDNALGEIYASSGDFARAGAAYGRALHLANTRRDVPRRTLIRANFAAAYWWNRDARHAYDYYGLARDDHGELAGTDRQAYLRLLPLRMGTLEGLADCHRHWGEYDEALQCARDALAVPASDDYPGTPEAREFALSRSVVIGMKTAGWYAELGDREAAEQAVQATKERLNGHDEDWLRSRYENGLASVQLDRDVEEAMRSAQKAVELARKYTDPVILLQARTTLCQAYLAKGDLENAARQIESAARYRHVGRPLLTPALQALVSMAGAGRGGDDGGKAVALFHWLFHETTKRIRRDEHDVTAWDFKGFAICGLRLNGQGSLDEAVTAFQTARATTRRPTTTRRATPGLVDRLLFLLDRLGACAQTPERLLPVVDALSTARARAHEA